MKQNIDICEFLSDCLIFFLFYLRCLKVKLSHICKFKTLVLRYCTLIITILKIMGFLKLERNDIDVSIIFLEVHVILMIYCLAIF